MADSRPSSLYSNSSTLVDEPISPASSTSTITPQHLPVASNTSPATLQLPTPTLSSSGSTSSRKTKLAKLSSLYRDLKAQNEARKQSERQYATASQAAAITGYGDNASQGRGKNPVRVEPCLLLMEYDPEVRWGTEKDKRDEFEELRGKYGSGKKAEEREGETRRRKN
ncbi:hypothetical protein P154DRAFT_577667 [Amniculicola lignicola CBS 123094]|uniref:Uncharacterized protein n=1 Tax=Amniculicola lignicola CBS 123094 TaxID=1392246 RepID=A0A6A5WDD7_9PLEO|nr:hypothetical protein P154DRAFT_577667 [Amniculicola lignicola CBS 123094]